MSKISQPRTFLAVAARRLWHEVLLLQKVRGQSPHKTFPSLIRTPVRRSFSEGGNKRIKNFIVLIILSFMALWLFGFMAGNAFGAEDINQQILDLRDQIEQLTKEAEKYRSSVNQKHKEADSLERQISLLTDQIARLRVQLLITNRGIDTTKLEIVELNEIIFDTQEDIDFDKKAMSGLIFQLYEQDQKSLLAVLLANSSISDFFTQAQQAINLSEQLTGALSNLKLQQEALTDQKNNLGDKRVSLENLRDEQAARNISLAYTKNSKDNLLDVTLGEEQRYQQLLNEAERKKQEFFNELKLLENQALETGAFIIHVTAPSIPPKSNIYRWPENNYVFTQSYGMTRYARRGAYGGAPHNGIDLAGGYGTAIRSIGTGTILASGFNNGFGNWVSVRHPNNLVSVYAHMQSPSGLSNTTPVQTGDIIGYEGSTGNSTGSHLHLSLYYDFFTFINEKNDQLYFNYFDGSLSPLDYLP